MRNVATIAIRNAIKDIESKLATDVSRNPNVFWRALCPIYEHVMSELDVGDGTTTNDDQRKSRCMKLAFEVKDKQITRLR